MAEPTTLICSLRRAGGGACGHFSENTTRPQLPHPFVVSGLGVGARAACADACCGLSVVTWCVFAALWCVSGGVGPGEGDGDEEVGSLWDSGQRGDLHQPAGGSADSTCPFQPLVPVLTAVSECVAPADSGCAPPAHEAPESRSHHLTTDADRPADRDHLLQGPRASRDPQGLLRRPAAPGPGLGPPAVCGRPLPETGTLSEIFSLVGKFGGLQKIVSVV